MHIMKYSLGHRLLLSCKHVYVSFTWKSPEGLCAVMLYYVCCTSQERINVTTVPMASSIFFQPFNSHLAYLGSSKQCLWDTAQAMWDFKGHLSPSASTSHEENEFERKWSLRETGQQGWWCLLRRSTALPLVWLSCVHYVLSSLCSQVDLCNCVFVPGRISRLETVSLPKGFNKVPDSCPSKVKTHSVALL